MQEPVTCDSSLSWQQEDWLGLSIVRSCYQQVNCTFFKYRSLVFDCKFTKIVQCGDVRTPLSQNYCHVIKLTGT